MVKIIIKATKTKRQKPEQTTLVTYIQKHTQAHTVNLRLLSKKTVNQFLKTTGQAMLKVQNIRALTKVAMTIITTATKAQAQDQKKAQIMLLLVAP